MADNIILICYLNTIKILIENNGFVVILVIMGWNRKNEVTRPQNFKKKDLIEWINS